MALAPSEIRRALAALRAEGAGMLASVVRLAPSASDVRPMLLDVAPDVLATFTAGSSALAVDWYSELREESAAATAYGAAQVVDLEAERIRRAVLWATDPLQTDGGLAEVLARLTPRAEEEVARGFWDTIEANTHRDTEAAGWRRDARPGACPFCRMIADRGAVFRKETAHFAAHKNCHCVAIPVFKGGEVGPEASVMQYEATSRRRSAAEQAALREYLREHYGA